MTLVWQLVMAQERLHLEVARAVVQVQVQEACSEEHCSLCATLASLFNISLLLLGACPYNGVGHMDCHISDLHTGHSSS